MADYLFQLSVEEAEEFLVQCFMRAIARSGSNAVARSVETPGQLLQMKEVCALLRISRPTCYEWMKAGRLPHYRKGSRIYFKQAEVLASLEKPKTKGK